MKQHWELLFQDLKFDTIVSNPPYVRNLEKARNAEQRIKQRTTFGFVCRR